MTTIHPDQIASVDVIMRRYISDPKVLVFGVFMEAMNAYLDSAPGKKSKAARPDKGEPEGFDRFYTIFPLHKARRDAAKAYGEALKRAPAGIILAGAQRYAAEMAGTEPKYIKHPGTWLRADCWADVPMTLALVQTTFEDCSTASWVRRLEVWSGKTDAPRGTWRVQWGPKPREDGCRVPESAKTAYLEQYPPKAQKGA